MATGKYRHKLTGQEIETNRFNDHIFSNSESWEPVGIKPQALKKPDKEQKSKKENKVVV